MKPQNGNWLTAAAMTISALICSSGISMAADKGAVDPSGMWKLLMINPQTKAKLQNSEHTLQLSLEDGRLTGTIDGFSEINGTKRIFKWPIKDTKLQGNDISFAVTHPPVTGRGPDSTTTYKGNLLRDTIKGTSVLEFNGVTIKKDFEARRVKE